MNTVEHIRQCAANERDCGSMELAGFMDGWADEIEKLHEALSFYGSHRANCRRFAPKPYTGECDCGFSTIQAPTSGFAREKE